MSVARRGGASSDGRRVVRVSRKGKFATADLLFDRGPDLSLDREARRLDGRIALAEVSGGKARIVRDIGSPENARDVVLAKLSEGVGHYGFRKKVEGEAREAAAAAKVDPGARKDLTELATFTVDPATARDFDDAVSARREEDGTRLWVHIADVAAHVKPGSSLDETAAERSNSTYVPGAVEPMLPKVLSADACSLAPDVERLAVTTEIELSGSGDVIAANFYRSLIRSDARLDYDQLDELFAGRGTAPERIAEPLEVARRIAGELGRKREGTALVVDSREPEFEFDSAGDVVSAHGVEQTEAHRLIERLMILTNEQVALLLEKRRAPTIFRVHEQPDPARVERLIEQLASLDVPTPALPKNLAPAQAAEIATEASRMVAAEAERRGHGRGAYTSLVLRSLSQAVYSDRNLGHAGLGSQAYCHFTSAIRRYPDLVAHRALLAVVGEGESAPRREEVRETAVLASERERESARIERDADDICSCFLLRRELFDAGPRHEFEGEVRGVIGAGLFVAFSGELGDVYEGFLPARSLAGERFDMNDQETAQVGKKTGRAVRLGDPVSVRVERIEAPRGRVDLEPVDG